MPKKLIEDCLTCTYAYGDEIGPGHPKPCLTCVHGFGSDQDKSNWRKRRSEAKEKEAIEEK